ncbi:MAG TPA: HD domain-containing phosphohydrolase [Albitalea sp.]|uniref:HD domain-containing phosphohydrolase n=1 Tax=Piscinibacter sp. TaxID=1903157 RepID=UPI002ECFB61A
MAEPIGAGFSVLAVDDEPNIVSALRRTLRSRGFTVHTALGGAEGLQVLEAQPVDAIISDMRMPEMTGAQFLQAARRKMPEAVRILLTGYADITSTIEAVNHGEIFRYLSKPWDDDVLLSVLHDGLERKRLARERDQLLALTREQNAQLAAHAEQLEDKVRERTRELQQASDEVKAAHARISADFQGTVKVLSTILEQRPGLTDGCARRVAEHVKALGPRVGLRDAELQDTVYAALLEDLGKLTFPEQWLTTPLHALAARDRDAFMKHPLHGDGYMMSLASLRGAGGVLRSLYERWDGKGAPAQLEGEAIPLGSRVLRAASEYERLRSGSIETRRFSHEDARKWLRNGSGTRFDPRVSDAFVALLNEDPDAVPTQSLSVSALKPGMVLAADLTAGIGVLLLSKDHLLDDNMIRRLDSFKHRVGKDLEVTVYRTKT